MGGGFTEATDAGCRRWAAIDRRAGDKNGAGVPRALRRGYEARGRSRGYGGEGLRQTCTLRASYQSSS